MAEKIKKEDAIEYISNMTVLDLSEFVKELEVHCDYKYVLLYQ